MNTHYVYFWSHKDFGILYIGQGTHGKNEGRVQKYSRAYTEHKRCSIDGFLKNRNIKPDITILCDNLTKEEANLKEIYLINLFGRRFDKSGCLLNVAPGGHLPCSQKSMKKIIVNNIEFESIAECARFYGVSNGKIRRCLRVGIEIVSKNRTKKQIEYNGKIFNSIVELSKFLKLPEYIVSNRLRKNIPLENYSNKIQVKIDGKIFDSISQAKRETGLTEKHIRYWYNKGKYYP